MSLIARPFALCAGIILLSISACTSSMHESKDFERVTYSQLNAPLSGEDFLWFDVKLSAQYPDNDDIAEAKRMEWLNGWLARRSACFGGYDITERRPFEFLEHNPGRYDLRYKIECKPLPVAE